MRCCDGRTQAVPLLRTIINATMTLPQRDLLILGASAVALNVLDIAKALGLKVHAVVDETLSDDSYVPEFGRKVSHELEPWLANDRLGIVIAIGDNYWRQAAYERISGRVPEGRFATLVHPEATVAENARIGIGSIVLPGSRVGPCAEVGRFSYLTANTVISHHCTLGDFVSMSPGATLGGRVSVGQRSSIGMNSSVRERCVIGDDVIVGANSFVNWDAPESCILGGVPATILRKRTRGEQYLR